MKAMDKQIVGIDEAGRGPVIGPLVMAGVKVSEKDIVKLETLGLKDSKLLSPKQRDEFFFILSKLDYIEYEISTASPKEIDDILNSINFNLNSFEALHSALIINKLKPDIAILDLPSNNAAAYNESVRINLNVKVELISEHKADMNYAVVSAASIFAKVTRDREIEKLKKSIGIDFGSGYPSDPKTVEFLEKNYAKKEYSDLFRKTWASYKRLVSEKNQKKLGEY